MFNRNRTISIVLLCFLVVVVLTQFTTVSPAIVTITPSTPTPWVKQDVLIEMEVGKGMIVWTDNIATSERMIDEIEGVARTDLAENGHAIYVVIDPRYSKVLVAKEIEDRLRLTSATLSAKGERE